MSKTCAGSASDGRRLIFNHAFIVLPLDTLLRRPLLRWLLLWLLWTLVGLVFVGQYYLFHITEHIPFLPDRALWVLVGWYPWIVLTPLVVRIARRYHIERPNWGRRLAAHLGIAVVLSVLEVAVVILVMGVVAQAGGEAGYDFGRAFRNGLLRSFFVDILVYMIIGAVVHALDYYHKYQERDLRTAQLEMRLVQAQLQALRMQLNPHFLFNTLHAISSLMDEDVRAARRMIANLSDLLRHSLDSEGDAEVPLDQEIVLLERYLNIEQLRFQDRLTVEMEIDRETRDVLVPNLILQPLVENAIKHGIAPYARGGRIVVRARRAGDRLVLQVEDDGPGFSRLPGGVIHEGVGLKNTRERLNQLYGAAHRFDLSDSPDGGFLVTLEIPFRT